MGRKPLPLLLLLLPAACTAASDPADPAAVLQEALASHQASMTGLGGRPAAAATPAEPAAAATPVAPASLPTGGPAPVPAAIPPPPAGAPSAAAQFLGQPPEAVLRWLGEPRLRRSEGSAETWHYQAAQCHLDLVLYREAGPQPSWRVGFAAARAIGMARRDEAACLRDLSRGSGAAPSPPASPRGRGQVGTGA
jgi:hypothetical protein